MDYLRTYAENTLVSTADSSPQPVIRIVEKRKQKSKQVNTKLKLIEVVDILKEDTAVKCGIFSSSFDTGDVQIFPLFSSR